jgi:hypothetical protein
VPLFSGGGASHRLIAIARELEQAIRFAYLAESFSTSTWRVLLSGPRHPHRGRSGTPDRRRDALLVRDPEWSNKNRLALGGDVILIFQPIPKPAVNDLPLIANRTKIEKVRPFSL